MTATDGSNDPRLQSPPPNGKGCLKNLAVGCLGMILGSVLVIGIEIAGAASLIGPLSTALLGAAGSSSSSGSSGSGNYGNSGSDGGYSSHGGTETDLERSIRKDKEKREAEEVAEKDARSAEDAAAREQELNRIHDKLAEPSKPW